jgi:hypothetical protein
VSDKSDISSVVVLTWPRQCAGGPHEAITFATQEASLRRGWQNQAILARAHILLYLNVVVT